MVVIGFMLSPLSWWNDLFVNVPLAVGFGWLVSLVYRPAFAASVVAGYWLTNVLGFVLLHKGTQQLLTKPQLPPRWGLAQSLLISLLYTLVIVVLVRMKVLQPVAHYFASP